MVVWRFALGMVTLVVSLAIGLSLMIADSSNLLSPSTWQGVVVTGCLSAVAVVGVVSAPIVILYSIGDDDCE